MRKHKRAYASLEAWFTATGKTQAQAAAELGMSVPYFNQLLSHKRQPTLDKALDLARRLNIPVESLRKTSRNAK